MSEYKLFLKQTAKLEDNVAEEHKNMRYKMNQSDNQSIDNCSGDVPSDAEFNFLRRVSTLDTYGFDPYTVKVHKQSVDQSINNFTGQQHRQSSLCGLHTEWFDGIPYES